VNNDNNTVTVVWDNQNGFWWNETCAMVLEVFGLPGHRFVYTPSTDFMTFTFKDKRDAFMCRILLSDRI
jgi:hypothetical protein